MIAALLLLLAPGARDAGAGVSVSINIGPPPIVAVEPPEIVMVPGAQVYFVPDPQIDIFFYAGYWWSPRGTRWYRAPAYNGPWVHIIPAAVPSAVVYMPRDYRVRYANAPRYPYAHWKREHYRWEKQHAKDHWRWEKEREKEWRQRAKNDRYNRHYLRGNGPGPAPGGPHYHPGGPGPGDRPYDRPYDRRDDRRDDRRGDRGRPRPRR
jgi:hypothetical protein